MGRKIAQAIAITFALIGVLSAASAPIAVSPSSATIEVAATTQFTATNASGQVVTARWSSSAPGIASVDANGVVSGVAAGTATITAKNGRYTATAQVTVSAPTTVVTAPAPTPSPTPTVDPSWIQLYPGDSIQNMVNLYPGATTFYLTTGVYHQQRVVPKSGDQFIGAAGAVLDGDGITAHAFETLTSAPTGVRIQGLEIRNYVPPLQRGAIQGDNGTDWVITGNSVHDNANHGVRGGPRAQVLNNVVYRNGKLGIGGYKADGMLVDGNEVYLNDISEAAETASTAEASGIKFVACHDVTISNNYVHDNYGKGIWSDTNYPTIVIENNHVTDNRDAGIWHEISYDAVIRNNTVERNGGTTAPSWLQRGGINVTNSPNVQVYGNTVLDNANGIGVMYVAGYTTTGPYGAYIIQNLSVHDNTVRMSIGRTGLAQNVGDTSIYTSRNNHFEHDTYYLGVNSAYYLWNEQNVSEYGWKADGNDTTGTFVR